jgi:hypothetical protein
MYMLNHFTNHSASWERTQLAPKIQPILHAACDLSSTVKKQVLSAALLIGVVQGGVPPNFVFVGL